MSTALEQQPDQHADLERERLHRAALCALAEPGDIQVTRLVQDHGGTWLYERLLEPVDDPLVRETRRAVAARLAALEPERLLEQGDRLGLRFVIPGDPEWPGQLDDLAHVEPLHDRGGVPVGLWVRGPLPLTELTSSVAIVGSRSATDYGATLAAEIAGVTSRAGVTVLSGGALGIDEFAHRGAVAASCPTVAVLACGADRIYPLGNERMFARIVHDGALVSEAPLGGSPMRVRFLARNRLIAALTRGTVVVEAAVRSGALNTANWANRLSRQLMGTPGPVGSAQSQGVHELLRRSATVVTRGTDVLELLGASGEHLPEERRAPETDRDRLRPRDRQILDGVPRGSPATAADVARAAGADILRVQSALNRFEQRGLVEYVLGGWVLTEEAARS
jgi:DNA processing protein